MFLLFSMLTEKKHLKNKDFLSENNCRQKNVHKDNSPKISL